MEGLILLFGIAIVALLVFILLVLIDIRTEMRISNVWLSNVWLSPKK